MSTWTTGMSGRRFLCLKPVPRTTARSAFWIAFAANLFPTEPRTPIARGWVSGTTPLALVVVAMGALSFSASLTTSPPQLWIPQPPKTMGLLLLLMILTAFSTSPSVGETGCSKR